jgi:HK97 family phage portal protein
MGNKKRAQAPNTLMGRIGSFAASIAKRAGVSLGDDTVNWRRYFGIPYRGDRAPQQRTVTPEDALTIDAFFQSCRIKSEAFADCIIELYQRTEKGVLPAVGHPTYARLKHNPSLDHTRGDFWKLMGFWLAWRGNAYASIQRDPETGKWLNLTPMFPDWVKPDIDKDTGDPCYIYRPAGRGPVRLWPHEVFHMMGPSIDGRQGLDPVRVHQKVLSTALSVGDYQIDYFERGHAMTGVLSFQHALDDDAKTNLERSLGDFQEGGNKRHGILIAEEGGTFSGINSDPERAQLAQTDSNIVLKISRITGVPPSFLMVPGSSYQTAEQEDLRLLKYSLGPMFTSAREEVDAKLLVTEERGQYYARVNTSPLAKADSLTDARVKALKANWGTLTVNQWCDDDERPHVPGGDVPMRPANMDSIGVDTFAGSAPPKSSAVDSADPMGDQPSDPLADAPLVPVADGTTTGNVASTGLNGAQIDSLINIVLQVATGILPLATGKALVEASFPLLGSSQIESIFSGVKPGQTDPNALVRSAALLKVSRR